jgi:hypothetical protein
VPDRRLAAHRLPALAFAGFLAVIAASAAVLFVLKLGGSPARLATSYRGDEASFVPARSFDGLLLVALPHLVAIPLVLFAAAHVVGWARVLSERAYRALLWLSFGSAATSISGGFLVRFVAPELAWLKVLSFAGLEAGLLAWAALLVMVFLPLGRRVAVPLEEPSEEVRGPVRLVATTSPPPAPRAGPRARAAGSG